MQQMNPIAHKLWVGDLLKGEISRNENVLSFVEVKGKQVVRVHVIANVIDKYVDERISSITIDDASGQIRVKAFSSRIFDGIEVGDSVRVIGSLKWFNNELYILPDIIKKVDVKWLLVRKLELGKEKDEGVEVRKNTREDIIKIIKENGGMDIDKLIMRVKMPVDEVNQVVKNLLEEGVIFESRPGHVRIL